MLCDSVQISLPSCGAAIPNKPCASEFLVNSSPHFGETQELSTYILFHFCASVPSFLLPSLDRSSQNLALKLDTASTPLPLNATFSLDHSPPVDFSRHCHWTPAERPHFRYRPFLRRLSIQDFGASVDPLCHDCVSLALPSLHPPLPPRIP